MSERLLAIAERLHQLPHGRFRQRTGESLRQRGHALRVHYLAPSTTMACRVGASDEDACVPASPIAT